MMFMDFIKSLGYDNLHRFWGKNVV